MDTAKPKILLLVVENRDYLPTEYAKWMLHAFSQLYGVHFWEGKRKPIWFMRQQMLKRALETKCTHVLFVDTDVIPQEGFLEKLLFLDADIATGIYYHADGTPVSRKDGLPFKGQGAQKVDMGSMGAALIKRQVIKKVMYPQPDNVTIDADIEFAKLVREAGFKIVQDFDNKCVHLLFVPVCY
jgi:hypothetical protein